MARASLAERIREGTSGRNSTAVGPFVTISRQHGCRGAALGFLLADELNFDATGGQRWQVYHKEILSRLATETNVAQDMLQYEQTHKPSLIEDFFRSFSEEHIPSGYEIRRRITMIVRGVAIQGHAILIGQGGTAATRDLGNGLSIRLEAPEQWRARQTAAEENVATERAIKEIREIDAEREYVRRFYESHPPRRPGFDIVYDCSALTHEQIARHVVGMMRIMRLVR
jgi:hypothetical protein